MYEIRDPVHGLVSFNELEKMVIDSQPFQRLKNINQLSWTHYVYPGANHKRFEHSIGVMENVTRFIDRFSSYPENSLTKDIISSYLPDEGQFKRMKEVFRLAGLLHDIGHAPFSHASEDLMGDRSGIKITHEDYTDMIIRENMRPIFENAIDKGINPHEIESSEVAEAYSGDNPKWIFLKELLDGPIDADRCDYLIRDSLHLGVMYGVYDLERLINTMVLYVSDDEETENQSMIHIDEMGKDCAASLIIARHMMFSQVYFHKTRRIFDYHHTFIMKEFLQEKFDQETFPLDVDQYLSIDDIDVLSFMKSRRDVSRFILDRDHLRMVCNLNDYDDIKDLKDYLTDVDIRHYIDDQEKPSYMKPKNKGKDEIFIYNNNMKQRKPLSYSYSGLKEFKMKFKRLYVEKSRKDEVIKWLKRKTPEKR